MPPLIWCWMKLWWRREISNENHCWKMNEWLVACRFGIHGNQWTSNILHATIKITRPLAFLERCRKTRMNKRAQNWIKLDSPDRNCLLEPYRVGQKKYSVWHLFAWNLNSSIKSKFQGHFCGKTSKPNEQKSERKMECRNVSINIMPSFPSLSFLFAVWKKMEINLLLHSDSIIEFLFSVGIYWT